MSFETDRIQHDLDTLLVPLVSCRLRDREFFFTIRVTSHFYRGNYSFRLDFPDGYPFKSPKLFCLSRTFHPNIDDQGRVCLKVLREGWLPSYDLNSIVVTLIDSFYNVSGEDVLNTEAGDLFDQDPEAFLYKIRETETSNK